MPLYSEGYSAPELILGKNITEKCDYYSIGIIMSEILLSQKNEDDITSNIEEWTGRKEIKDILLSLVQEKPENRPDSLENVMVVLEQLIGNLNTSSCSYSIAIDSRKLVQLILFIIILMIFKHNNQFVIVLWIIPIISAI